MDQMIDQIKGCIHEDRILTAQEEQLLASYLMGQTPFKQITTFLPTIHCKYYLGYYGQFYHNSLEILAACAEDSTLLPRLGRHLMALEHINHKFYESVTNSMGAHSFTPKQMFIDTGLGIDAMLRWLPNESPNSLFDLTGTLDFVETDYPGQIEAFVTGNKGETLQLSAFLCGRQKIDILQEGAKPNFINKLLGKDSQDLSAILTRDILLASAVTASQWGRAKEFRASLEKHLPAALTLINEQKAAGVLSGLDKDQKTNLPHQLTSAITLTQYQLPMVNILAQVLCETAPFKFIDALYWALSRDRKDAINLSNTVRVIQEADQKETTEFLIGRINFLRTITDQLGIDPAAPCAWAATYLPQAPTLWKNAFTELFGGDRELLTRARAISSPLERVVLARALYDLTGTLPEDAPADCIRTLAQMADVSSEELQKVAAYFLGEDVPISSLPRLDAYYAMGLWNSNVQLPHTSHDPDAAIWLLAEAHPITGRYLRYISANGRSLRLEYATICLTSLLGKTPQEAADFLAEQVDPQELLRNLALCATINENYPSPQQAPLACFRALIHAHPQAATAAMDEKTANAAARLCLLDHLYQVHPNYNSDILIHCLADKSKKVRQLAIGLLMPKKELVEQIRPLLEAKKKDVRAAAEQLITAYEGVSTIGADTDILGLCTRTMPRAARASIRWAFPDDLPIIRWKESGEPAEETVVLYYLTLYLGAKSMDLPATGPRIREVLNEDDLRLAAQQVYDGWIADGASTKQKGALLLYGVHAGDGDVLILQRQIENWSLHSRGAIAAEAVRAMAMGGSDLALMTVDSMSRKYKNKQVRRAAGEAFAAAAQALATTPQALGDRIIPTLGFDERGEKIIDYGPRTFTATLSPSLTIQLQDQTGKTIKSLPKPGAKDNTQVAQKAKSDFSALKKSLKAVVNTQTQRLEQALATGRRWNPSAWEKLYVQNPIMHTFAIGLVWGVYQGETLQDTFRYMEDGSFTTMDEDDFDFAALGEQEIGLVHPLDLNADALAGWQQQLEDYDIAQPILQLNRPVYLLEDGEAVAVAIDRFGGKKMLGITLMNKLQKSGWYRGSVLDAGAFYTFYQEMGGLGIQLYFSGMFVSPDVDKVITIGQVGFYQPDGMVRGSYYYDDIKKEQIIPLREISPRMFSEVVLDVTQATATSSETDEKWKLERQLLFFDGK